MDSVGTYPIGSTMYVPQQVRQLPSVTKKQCFNYIKITFIYLANFYDITLEIIRF